MNPQDVIDLAISYTKEASELKDYQVPTRKARNARKGAANLLSSTGYLHTDYPTARSIADSEKWDIEECNPNDPNEYYWALVPEYDAHKKAKIVLRRVGTEDGEIILPQEKRQERPLKISVREAGIVRQRKQKALIAKIRNYEAQIKKERRRLSEQINRGDKVYMEASAIELTRILESMKEDLDDFISDISCPF